MLGEFERGARLRFLTGDSPEIVFSSPQLMSFNFNSSRGYFGHRLF